MRNLARYGAPCALAALLMAPGLAEPYGGFLAFSEAWYTLVAAGFADGSWLLPQVAPGRPDFNIPPLFAWSLAAAFRLLGTSELVARLVAVTTALAATAATVRIGGARAGLLLASSPAFVLLGRNVQPDTMSTALALLAYAGRRRTALSASLFGLAILTKPTVLLFPAALALAAAVSARGIGWLRWRHVGWAAGSMLPISAWVLVQLALHRDPFLAGLRHGGSAFEWPALALLPTLAGEVWFAGFPAFTLLLPAVLGWRRWRNPGTGDAAAAPAAARVARGHAAAVVAVGLATYGFVHYHGYYLVALLPAAAICAGGATDRRPALVIVAVSAVASLIYLGGHKLGRVTFADLARQTPGATWLLSPAVYDGYWTLFALYGKPRAIVVAECAEATAAAPVVMVPPPPEVAAAASRREEAARALAALGIGAAELPRNPHHLAWGGLRWVRTDRLLPGFAPVGSRLWLRAWRVPAGRRACPPGMLDSEPPPSEQTFGR